MDSLERLIEGSFWGVPLARMVAALACVLVGIGAGALVRKGLGRLARRVALHHQGPGAGGLVWEALIKPVGWLVILGGAWLGWHLLAIPPEHEVAHDAVALVLKGASILLLVWFGMRFSDAGFALWASKSMETETRLDDRMVPILKVVARVVLVLIGGTFFLQNLGYSVGSLLAGLGLGGAALALASKDLLANIFGAVSIFWDRSFEVGDWVQIGEVEGNVEEVGLRATRIRTFPDSLVTLPNSSLTTGTINNWTQMKKRRAQLNFRLSLETPSDKVVAVVEAFKATLASDPALVPGDFIVGLDKIDEVGLLVSVQYYTVTVVAREHLAAKQAVILRCLDICREHEVELASLPASFRK